jgi:predicted dehydrogenase
MADNISRRKFILTGGAVASGIAVGFPGLAKVSGFSASDQIRIGIIGTGSRGNWLNSLIKATPGISVNACCDVIPAHLQRGLNIAEKGAKGYEDYRKLLENKDLDAVVIATPLSMHTQMAKDAIDVGKHIYCEKTMSFNIKEALELTKIVKKSKLTFQVGYQHRYNPLYHKLYNIINDGHIGKVTHLAATWNRNGNWRRAVSDPKLERLINWRMYLEYSGGLIGELSSHQMDIVSYLLGKNPVRIMGMGGIDHYKDGRETFDNVYTVFDYEDGIKASYNCITTNAYEGFGIKFYGTEATVVIRGEQSHKAYIYVEPKKIAQMSQEVDGVSSATLMVWEKGEPIEVTVENQAEGDAAPTGAALAHFAECIRGKQKVMADVDYGRKGSIAVYLANKAIMDGTIEHWKNEYNA